MEDPRAVARAALAQLRDTAVCGHCRKDYETMMDALAADGEFEELMRRYVEVHERHREADHLDERAGEIREARDEAARRLYPPAPTEPAPANGPALAAASTPAHRAPIEGPLGLRSLIAPWRKSLSNVVPRPIEDMRRAGRRTR